MIASFRCYEENTFIYSEFVFLLAISSSLISESKLEQTENADINFVHYHLGKLDSSNLFVDMT